MQQAAARSAIERTEDRAKTTGEVVSITLGVQRPALAPQQGTLRELILSIVSTNQRPTAVQPSSMPATDATLLLTEANFAPPEAVLPILARIAAFALVASGSGAAAYMALSLIP
jgi:hypothetical protein